MIAVHEAATTSDAMTDDLATMIDAAALDTAETLRWQHPCEATTDATMTDLLEDTTTDLQEVMTIDLQGRTMTDLQEATMMEEDPAAEAATMIDEEAMDQHKADLQHHTTTDEAAAHQNTADASETMRTDDPETTHPEALRSQEDTRPCEPIISLMLQSDHIRPLVENEPNSTLYHTFDCLVTWLHRRLKPAQPA